MTVKQNRPAPAFQEYAANMLTTAAFRGASLSAKGLLFQLRLECWVNPEKVPCEPLQLSKFLGVRHEELVSAYPEVASFFRHENKLLRCPELDDYRAYLLEVSRKQSEGGKKGAAKTNAARSRDTCVSLDKSNSDQTNPEQSDSVIKEDDDCSDWMAEYEHAEIHGKPAHIRF